MLTPDCFTPGALLALTIARETAQRFGHRGIGAEHLVLGLIQDDTGGATVALRRLGVPLDAVRRRLKRILWYGMHESGEAGFTAQARRVLALAGEEARQLGHRLIGTEAVLLAVMREGESMAAGLLGELVGGRLQRLGADVVDRLTGPPAEGDLRLIKRVALRTR
jgi:ATP-dependent Clp protease ATP-binding subunit ClpC